MSMFSIKLLLILADILPRFSSAIRTPETHDNHRAMWVIYAFRDDGWPISNMGHAIRSWANPSIYGMAWPTRLLACILLENLTC